MAVEYSKVREQFGKPIGAYQALQHAAAEIVADLEPARSLLWYAAYAQDAVASDAPRSASMVKARVCEAYMRNTDKAVLMHGGIAFTWEHDIHLWFKTGALQRIIFWLTSVSSGTGGRVEWLLKKKLSAISKKAPSQNSYRAALASSAKGGPSLRRGRERQAKACPTVSADNRGLGPLARCSGSGLGSAMK